MLTSRILFISKNVLIATQTLKFELETTKYKISQRKSLLAFNFSSPSTYLKLQEIAILLICYCQITAFK